MPAPIVILIGLRGSGKSTLGRALAARLGIPYVDMDERTPGEMGCLTVREAFERGGERAFREAEARALRAELDREGQRVLATGGGTPTAPGAEALLRSARQARRIRIVYLRAQPATLRDRLAAADNSERPSLTDAGVLEEIETVFAQRDPLYRSIADAVMETDAMSEEQATEAMASIIRI